MSFSINDLKELKNSEEYKKIAKKHIKLLFLWEEIYKRRKELWLTKTELAEKVKISQKDIDDLELSNYWEPSSELLIKLANTLDVHVDYLLIKKQW